MLRRAVEAVLFCLPFVALAWLIHLGLKAVDAYREPFLP